METNKKKELKELLLTIPEGPAREELLKQLDKEKAAEEKRIRDEANAKVRAEYDLRVKALIETAMAYYRRGEALQYDSVALVNAGTRDGGIGLRRATDEVSPEDATMNTPMYFVCSTFIYNVLYEALGYRFCGDANSCTCVRQGRLCDASVVYHWKENYGETREEAAKIVRSILRPGDILTGNKKTGHTMLFLGDFKGDGVEYMLHSWGGKYSMKTCKEAHEAMGTIRLQPVDELCFVQGNKEWYTQTRTPRWSMYDDMQEILVLRPLRLADAQHYPLTPNAQARLSHPGLNIDRVATPGQYRNVPNGGTITYTLTVENQSDTDYTGLPVMEKIPAGTALTGPCDGEIREGALHWLLDIPAGGSKTLTYSVLVNAKSGWVVSEGGNVAGIRANVIKTLVAPVLTAEDNARLLELADNMPKQSVAGLELANWIYEKYLGKTLALPDAKTLVTELVEPTTGEKAEGPLVRRKAEHPMVLPRYQGGKMLVTKDVWQRVLEFTTDYLQPGDILLYVTKPLEQEQTETVYVYLGGDAFATITENGATVTREDVLWPAFAQDLFFCFRPTLAE